MSPVEVTLKEHLEALWVEREKRIDEQFDGIHTALSVVRVGVEQTQVKVTKLEAAREATLSLRAGDYARVGALAAAIGLFLPLVLH